MIVVRADTSCSLETIPPERSLSMQLAHGGVGGEYPKVGPLVAPDRSSPSRSWRELGTGYRLVTRAHRTHACRIAEGSDGIIGREREQAAMRVFPPELPLQAARS